MPDLDWNRQLFDGDYRWSGGGEEWSIHWGGSEAQWFGALFPRLHRALPAGSILEIAPGFGRWTKFLLPLCHRYVGIDLSAACIAACRERFADATHARFAQNDGLSLGEAPDGSIDLVFSFDSLVHVELDVFREYIPQIARKLSRSGVAFLHHSNFHDVAAGEKNSHNRGLSVSARRISELVAAVGGHVLVQEIINWGGTALHDCFTLFGSDSTYGATEPMLIENPGFMHEATVIKNTQSFYSRIPLSPTGAVGRPLSPFPATASGDESAMTRQRDDARQESEAT